MVPLAIALTSKTFNKIKTKLKCFNRDYLRKGSNIYCDNDQKSLFQGLLKIVDHSFNH